MKNRFPLFAIAIIVTLFSLNFRCQDDKPANPPANPAPAAPPAGFVKLDSTKTIDGVKATMDSTSNGCWSYTVALDPFNTDTMSCVGGVELISSCGTTCPITVAPSDSSEWKSKTDQGSVRITTINETYSSIHFKICCESSNSGPIYFRVRARQHGFWHYITVGPLIGPVK